MKRKRDPEHSELLPFEHIHVEDDKGKEEAISDSSESMLVEEFLSECDSTDADEVSGLEQPLSFQDLAYDIFSIISTYLPNQDLARLARTCKRNHNWACDPLEKREKETVSSLLLAVVQGEEAKVKRLLGINPGLLRSKKGRATDYSMRLFQDLTPFQAALCNGDVEMCEMMKKDYFSQFEDGQAEIRQQFNAVFPNGIEAHVKIQQDNVFDFNEILQAIIHASDNEVTAALDKAFDNNLPLHRALEKFRKTFTEKSLSEMVFNPYHLLKAFETYSANLGNWDKRDLFWRQAIGFVQRYLSACTLQVFAQGIYYIVKEKEPLQPSFGFKWGNGSILPSKDFSDLGFDFGVATGRGYARLPPATCVSRQVQRLFEIMCRAKTSSLEELLSPIQWCKRELSV